MARTESVLTIFLASPGDVVDERNRLEDAVLEWNRTWARNLGVRLELLRWEHDAYPGIGEDAQDVINEQLPTDYDLFIGIMWSRFGTPTRRAGSGTVEEFERALARYRASPGNVSILFYFKDTPIPPSKLDASQIQKLQDFKRSLSSEGLLHWEFTDTDQFEKLVSMHITKHVQNWRHKQKATSLDQASSPLNAQVKSTSVVAVPARPTEEEDDDGYLDLLVLFLERNAEVGEITGRLTAAQSDLTTRTTQGTVDLQNLAATPGGADPAHARRLIGKVADEMVNFTNRINAEVPLLRAAMSGSVNALTRAAAMSADFDSTQTREARVAAAGLLAAMAGARLSMIEFKGTTLGLPRMTKELNAAKRKQGAALDALISEMANGEQLLVECLTVLDTLLAAQPPQQ
ncbi:hypothetical protein [Rhodoferax sp.]|uniref:hypothetical protein n=1 Tax=Rhodoferax sp. TaxID=50421 RepID=UPI002633C006|nr:hypothetical protein [Rhodoferax sp.]